jgi:hypothetical protein
MLFFMRLILSTLLFSFLLVACGPGHAPVSHTELAGKWEVVDLKIDSDYIDANPKFKQGVIEGMMGMTYVFSEESYLTITIKEGVAEYGEYTIEDNGNSLSHDVSGGKSLSAMHLKKGNLYLVQGFDDVDGTRGYTTLVLRKR